MRTLRLLVRTHSGALPVLLAASILPNCGTRTELPSEEPGPSSIASAGQSGQGGQGGQGEGGSSGQSGQGGAFFGGNGGQGQAGTILIGGSSGSATEPKTCDMSGGDEKTLTVPLPNPGVPAEPGQICSVSVEPVTSGQAARVTLETIGTALNQPETKGFCAIPPDLEPRVLAEPVIEVVDTNDFRLKNVTFSDFLKQPGGYSFKATMPEPLSSSFDPSRMTVRISLLIDCPTGTRLVHATTDIFLCQEAGGLIADQFWVSSGGTCTVCQIIAEMAPSPIVPGKTADRLPLARVLRLRLVELARVSGTVVLLAENDGGEELEYEWHPSGGHLEFLDKDVVAWTVKPGEDAAALQVAVYGPTSAAVASFAFQLDGERRADDTLPQIPQQAEARA